MQGERDLPRLCLNLPDRGMPQSLQALRADPVREIRAGVYMQIFLDAVPVILVIPYALAPCTDWQQLLELAHMV